MRMTVSEYHRYKAGNIFSAFCLPVFALTVFLHAESNASEYQEKAEFICSFAKFVRWPQEENADKPLQICIIGDNPFGTVLKNMGDKKVRGRLISFRVCPDGKGAEDCHIVFVSALKTEHLPAIISRFSSHPVLTVGDIPGFTAYGGIINLMRTGDQLHFEINTDAAHRSGLQISSQLLKLAHIVTKPSEKDNPQ